VPRHEPGCSLFVDNYRVVIKVEDVALFEAKFHGFVQHSDGVLVVRKCFLPDWRVPKEHPEEVNIISIRPVRPTYELSLVAFQNSARFRFSMNLTCKRFLRMWCSIPVDFAALFRKVTVLAILCALKSRGEPLRKAFSKVSFTMKRAGFEYRTARSPQRYSVL
jgi:hypothetical protein